MSDLIAIVYPTEEDAERMRQKLIGMQSEYLIELQDAVIATKVQNGAIKLNQIFHPAAAGALSGGFWGMLLGSLFLSPLLGAAIGAASGALAGALTDYGINDDFMRKLAAHLDPGRAALFLLIRKMTTDKVLDAVKGTGGTILQTSLNHAKEQALRDALTAVPANTAPPSVAAST